MTRRIHPRHCTETVTVRAWVNDGTILGALAAPVMLPRVMAQQSHEIATDGDGPRAVSLLEVRVPPRPLLDMDTLFAPDSEITYRGSTSYVLTCEVVRHRGGVAFTRIVAGDRPSRFSGAHLVDVVVHHSPGRDARGNPRPTTDVPLSRVLLVPGSTSDGTDFSEEPTADATLHLPAATVVSSTDTVTVLTSPLAGLWRVDGLPAPNGTTLKTPLTRG